MGRRDSVAGGDQQSLLEQYGDASGLEIRLNLYRKYHTAPVGWFRWLAGQVDWPPGGAVLEVGCGLGSLWVEAATRVPSTLRLTLTDLSPAMVTIASDRVRRLGKYAAVRVEDVDAEQLPFEDRSFDVVVANHVLYHTDPARAVPHLARVLRDDGLLVASTNGPCDHVVELSELSASVFGGASASETLEVFGSATGEPIVKRSFGNVERRNYEDELWCTDPNEVVAFIMSTRPGKHASQTQLDQLRSATQSRLDAGAGVYTLSKEAVVFLCRSPHRERP